MIKKIVCLLSFVVLFYGCIKQINYDFIPKDLDERVQSFQKYVPEKVTYDYVRLGEGTFLLRYYLQHDNNMPTAQDSIDALSDRTLSLMDSVFDNILKRKREYIYCVSFRHNYIPRPGEDSAYIPFIYCLP